MKKPQLPKYSWYQYHLAVKKYQNIHTRIEKGMEDGSFWQMAEKAQKELLRRLNILFKRLLKILHGVRLSAATATAAFFILTGNINGQSFTEQTGTNNPFNSITPGSYAVPTFVDIDNDGDFDAYVGIYGDMFYYENVGTNSAPNFNAPREIKLRATNACIGEGGFSYCASFQQAPSFVDIDGDGDFDAKVGQFGGSTFNFRNTGTATSPDFGTGTTSIDGLYTANSSYASPTFVDIDNDGDFDAFVGVDNGNINYYKNYGTSSAASFLSSPLTGGSNPLNGINVSSNAKPAFVDIDSDGDFDVFVGAGGGVINYYRNDGTAASPNFATVAATENPFNGVNVGNDAAPSFVDIDNDGGVDAFVGNQAGQVLFFKGEAGGAQTNSAPVIDRNTGVTLDEGGSTGIYRHMLRSTDPEGSTHMVYNVQNAPANGVLKNAGNALSGGDTFTQKDINDSKITYEHNGSETTSDSFSFNVSDYDGATSPTETFNITVNPINDAPVISNVENTPLHYLPGDPPVPVTNTLDLVDVDNDNLTGATVSLTNFDAGDELGFTDINDITGSFLNGVLSLSGTASVADYQAALRSVSYSRSSNAGNLMKSGTKLITAQDTIIATFKVNDGTTESESVGRIILNGIPDGQAAELAAPTNVTITYNTDGTITVSWTDNSGNELGFVIYRQIVSAANKNIKNINAWEQVGVVGVNETEFIDENVTEGVTYRYKVAAYNADGQSEEDDEGTTIIFTLIPPSDLTAAEDVDEHVVLNWTDNSEAEGGYKVERDDGNGFEEIADLPAGTTQYTDETVVGGESYIYRVKAYSATGESDYSNTAVHTVTDIGDLGSLLPIEFTLDQNYPNPFNPSTTIRFGLPTESHVAVTVFNILGQEMASLVNSVMSAGYHEVQFDATNLTSGIYIYKIQAGDFVQLKKMMLMK